MPILIVHHFPLQSKLLWLIILILPKDAADVQPYLSLGKIFVCATAYFCLLSKYTSLAWTDNLIVGSLLLWIWFCRIDPMPSLFLSLCTYFLRRTVFLSGFLSAPPNVQNIYKDVCKLAVLSGIEIDKAKRAYDSVRVSKEIDIIAKKYNADAPEFFQEIVVSDSKREKKHTFYDAPMEYVYKSVKGIDYRTGKDKQKTYIAISDMLKEPETKSTSTVYDKKRKIINSCEEYEQKLKLLYQDLRLADEDEKDIIYEKIRQTKEERNKQVKELLSEEYVLYLVIKDYEKEERENWHIYAPLLENELFKKMLKASKEKMPQVIQKDDGEYDLYGLKFTKIN